jgi:hypothetical protein
MDRPDRWARIEPEPVPNQRAADVRGSGLVPDSYALVPEEVRTALIPFRLAELTGPGLDSRPKGRLIVSRLSVHEEEVPRDGVSDAPPGAGPLVRWVSHSWVRREKSPGSGESSSGLAFDTVRRTGRWPG